MLPAYWPLSVAGLLLIACGVGLAALGRRVASTVAKRMQAAPSTLRGLFLLSPKPMAEFVTASYLTVIYRTVGVGWTVMGTFMVYAVIYGKPG
jgi:hypothetical protein